MKQGSDTRSMQKKNSIQILLLTVRQQNQRLLVSFHGSDITSQIYLFSFVNIEGSWWLCAAEYVGTITTSTTTTTTPTTYSMEQSPS